MTILYLTANQIPEEFAGFVRFTLMKAIGHYPLVSVSRKPLDFGTNILDDGVKNSSNIYWQMLRAAKTMDTEYIAIAEDDTLYHENHFNFYRPPANKFGYDQNRFALFLWNPEYYSWRNRKSNASLIAPRKLLIEALEERFAKYPNGTEPAVTGELGRVRLEKQLGLSHYHSEEVFAEVSMIQFNHDKGTELRQGTQRKGPGPIKAHSLYYWGPSTELIKHYV